MIYTYSSFGYNGYLITVETQLKSGEGSFDVVGLSDVYVASVKDTVQHAITNSGFKFPREHVFTVMFPIDVKKSSHSFDLSVALSVLSKQYDIKNEQKVFVMGELDTHGTILGVRAIEAGLLSARAEGIEYAIIPFNAEVNVPEGMKVCKAKDLIKAFNVYTALNNADSSWFTEKSAVINAESFSIDFDTDGYHGNMDEITGDNVNGIKFALTVAQAGRHNILLYGTAGDRKTSLAQAVNQITPKLLPDEADTAVRIHSIAGLHIENKRRPFRMPHQTSSIEGTCGGGVDCRPGEISLAHKGILFLDEAMEFRTSVLQMLRVPLETKQITFARAGRCTTYPADFQLVATTQPCPCGNYGVEGRICLCSARAIERYWAKLSAPLLDRITIKYNADKKDTSDMEFLTVDSMRAYVKKAWEAQYKRQGKLNSALELEEIERYIVFTEKAKELLTSFGMSNALSARGVLELNRLCATLQDMYGLTEVDEVTARKAIKLFGSTPDKQMYGEA